MHADSAYIDTSVLGAYYCPDPLSDAAEGALLQLREPFISSLTEVEFASLVARKGRLRELSDRQAGEILRRFGQHVTDGHYRRLPLGNEHLLRARDLIASMASTLSALDALHLAVAMAARIPVLTADRAFARAVRRHGAAAILVK